MELHEVIKQITGQFGKDVIAEKRFVYMIADYYSFRDNPAEKCVLAVLVNDGYTVRLLNQSESQDISIVTNQIVDEVCKSYGFREELVKGVVDYILGGLNLKVEEATPIVTSYSNGNENNLASNGNDYSEEYIVGLFPHFYNRFVHKAHAHMDAQKLMEIMNTSVNEANRLFIFLVRIGAFIYNYASQDYDINVSSQEELRRKYRNYINRCRGWEFPQSTSISHRYLESAMQKMVHRRLTSIDLLRKDLKEDKDEADEIYKTLLELKIINMEGQLLDIYLPYNAIADKVLNKLKNKQ